MAMYDRESEEKTLQLRRVEAIDEEQARILGSAPALGML